MLFDGFWLHQIYLSPSLLCKTPDLSLPSDVSARLTGPLVDDNTFCFQNWTKLLSFSAKQIELSACYGEQDVKMSGSAVWESLQGARCYLICCVWSQFLMSTLFPVDEISVKENKVNAESMSSLLLQLKAFEWWQCRKTYYVYSLKENIIIHVSNILVVHVRTAFLHHIDTKGEKF